MNIEQKPSAAIECMIATLKEKGWCKTQRQNRYGQVCLLGAMGQCLKGDPTGVEMIDDERTPLERELLAAIAADPEVTGYTGDDYDRTWKFNDRKAKSVDDGIGTSLSRDTPVVSSPPIGTGLWPWCPKA